MPTPDANLECFDPKSECTTTSIHCRACQLRYPISSAHVSRVVGLAVACGQREQNEKNLGQNILFPLVFCNISTIVNRLRHHSFTPSFESLGRPPSLPAQRRTMMKQVFYFQSYELHFGAKVFRIRIVPGMAK